MKPLRLACALGLLVGCTPAVSDTRSIPSAAGSAAPPPLAAGAGGAGALSLQPTAAGSGGAAATTHAQTRRIAAPPVYSGTQGTRSECTTPARTTGFEPVDGERHPLFLYFVGTEFTSADASTKYDCQAAQRVTEAMARRGFVALSVEYANRYDAIANKFPCLFAADQPEGLLTRACALPNVDCARGIATWGHSQGALLAHIAANYDARVKAVWTTGYSGNRCWKLPADRLRVVNGEADSMNGNLATLNEAAALSSADCPDDGRSQCLRSDGSGWILVRKAQCQLTSADHCWFDKRSCLDNAETLEPAWIDPASTAAFALEANAEWLAQTVARP